MKKIVTIGPDGIATIITPAYHQINHKTGKPYTVEEVAAKDVPTGYKYKIVEEEDLPTDRSFRDDWTVDEADLTDGVGADYGVLEP